MIHRMLVGVLGALEDRQFRLQFSARAVSSLGDGIAPVALAFGILATTHSGSGLGLVLAVRTVAIVVFVLVGGVWGDRVRRNVVMLCADVVRCGTQGGTATVLLLSHTSIWDIVIFQALNGAATGFFQPATTGLTPLTVRGSRLQQANSLLSFTKSASGIVGPLIAGVLITTVGPGYALSVDAASFAISAVLLAGIRLPASTGVRRANFFRELADGWSAVCTRSWVIAGISVFMLFQFLIFGAFFVLGPLVAEHSLGGARAWAAIAAGIGVGSVTGDLVGARWRIRRLLLGCEVVLLIVVPLLILLAIPAPLPFILAAAAVAGIAFTLPNTLWYTALQENIPAKSLSRVSSYDWIGSLALRPIGLAVAAPVAQLVGVRTALIGASLIFCVGPLAAVFFKEVRSLERHRDEATAALESTGAIGAGGSP